MRAQLAQDAVGRAVLDDAPLVLGDEQKVQPPKQPRMITSESLTVSNAGTDASPYIGCGARLNGRS